MMKGIVKMKLGLALILGLWTGAANAATTWYVTKSGKDSNAGTSENASLLTIQKAINNAASGDTIIVGDGEFKEHLSALNAQGVINKHSLTIRSKNGAKRTSILGGVLLEDYEPSSVLEGVTIKNVDSSVWSEVVRGAIVKKCVISKCTGKTIVSDCKVYNSLLYGNTLRSGCDSEFYHTLFYNCTIYENHGKYVAKDSMGTTFYNCIIGGHNNGRYICSNWGNYAYNCSEKDSGCVNPEGANFHLKATSSCIDAGNNSYVGGNEDLDGNPRIINGHVDIGAYEYQPPVGTVEKVIASPRYPWNGLVDLQFTIKGDDGVKFNTSFSAQDVAGGTNLTLKTLYKSNGTAANATKESLLPGIYNWVWNATADLGEGVVLDRVTISVNVQ